MVAFVFQNNEFLHEKLLYKGPTITERSKKVHNLLMHWIHAHQYFCALLLSRQGVLSRPGRVPVF